jgi:hypothetical protein
MAMIASVCPPPQGCWPLASTGGTKTVSNRVLGLVGPQNLKPNQPKPQQVTRNSQTQDTSLGVLYELVC